jgi:FixJ family two-component response regulator
MTEPVTVYVVDDEPVTATTLAAILNVSGFRATAFTSAEKHSEPPSPKIRRW